MRLKSLQAGFSPMVLEGEGKGDMHPSELIWKQRKMVLKEKLVQLRKEGNQEKDVDELSHTRQKMARWELH